MVASKAATLFCFFPAGPSRSDFRRAYGERNKAAASEAGSRGRLVEQPRLGDLSPNNFDLIRLCRVLKKKTGKQV